MEVPSIFFRVEYNGVNATADISKYLIDLVFNDAIKGECDDLSITISNLDRRWLKAWYPAIGRDKIKCWMGIGESELFCGTFTVDEVEYGFAPDTCTIKAIAAPTNCPIRSKKNRQLEQVTLRQIAQTIADENGLTLVDGSANSTISINLDKERAALTQSASTLRTAVSRNDPKFYQANAIPTYNTLNATADSIMVKGFPDEGVYVKTQIKIAAGLYFGGSLPDYNTSKGIVLQFANQLDSIAAKLQNRTYNRTNSTLENIQIGAITQYEESDIVFLNKLGDDYGIIFNVRDTDLVFTSIYDLDQAEGITTITIGQFKPGLTMKNTSTGTYKSAKVVYHNPEENELVESSVDAATDQDIKQPGEFGPNEDILQIRKRVENTQQAEALAKAALHKANSSGVTGSGSMAGNPFIMSGINFMLTGADILSGKYQVEKSTHRQSLSTGYEVSFDFKGVDKAPPGSGGSGTGGGQLGAGTDPQGVYGKKLDDNISNARANALAKHKAK